MRKCPNCGSTSIKEEVDKTKIIGYSLHDPIYAKVFVCKNCTHRWKPGEEVVKAPEPTPEVPEPTPEVPEPTPEVPEPTPVIPESQPEEPESTPEEPESTPEEPPTSD